MENNTIPTTLRRLLIIFGVLLIVSLLASGANVYMTLAAPQRAVTVPSTVGFEGRLADSSGQPLADGTYPATFTLYSQETGGVSSPCDSPCIWTEGQTVATHSGFYSVQLGATTALQPSYFDGPRWLGVTVNGNEMSPRIPISSVPFALNAQEAAHAEEADLAAEASHAADADQADSALGLQSRSVSANAPTDGQVLTWNASTSQWLPGTLLTPIPAQYPRRAFGFHRNDIIVQGNAFTCTMSASQIFNHYCYQNTPANGDTFTSSFMLQAGTYTLSAIGVTGIARGKIDWYVDDVPQISGQDWYASATAYNVLKSDSITVAGDGYHVLKGIVNGKTGTNYQILLTEWWIAPISD